MIENKPQNLDELKQNAGLSDGEDKELKDGIKDVQRNLKNAKKGLSIMAAVIPILIKALLVLAVVFAVVGLIDSFLKWLESLAAKETMDAIQEELYISNIEDLVELTGDSENRIFLAVKKWSRGQVTKYYR